MSQDNEETKLTCIHQHDSILKVEKYNCKSTKYYTCNEGDVISMT